MRGLLHFPVLGFVLGGVLAYLNNLSFFIVMAIIVLWMKFLLVNKLIASFILLCICAGYFYLAPSSPPHMTMDTSTSYTVKIVSPPEIHPQTIQLKVKDVKDKHLSVILFYIEESNSYPSSWKHGAVCSVHGIKKKIDGATNPGQFDYQKFMLKQGVFSQIEMKSVEDMSCSGQSTIAFIYEMRAGLMDKVKRSVTAEAYGWVAALVFGDIDHLDKDIIQWFRDFNLSHILAISGLHVGLLISLIYTAIVRLGIGTKQQARALLFLFMPVYILIAGAAPSVIRAVCMAMILLFLPLIKKALPVTDVLSLTAFSLLIISPAYLTSIAFQFSFIVTFSIILSSSLLKQQQSLWIQAFIIGFVSQLAILPLQLHYFYEFNPLSLFVNLLLVPYFSLFVIPSMFLLVILSYAGVSLFFSRILMGIHSWVLDQAETLFKPLEVMWVVGELPSSLVLVCMILFCMMMVFWTKGKLKTAFIYGVSFVFVMIGHASYPYFSSQGTVTMLDVGQGDSFIIELPYRKGVFMIDAAGPPAFVGDKTKTAEQVLIPYLKSRGISNVDGILVSHKDSDHSGSVPVMLKEFDVPLLIVSPYYDITEEGTQVVRVQGGSKLSLSGHVFEVLHPYSDEGETNDNSLMIFGEIGGKKWLFTGDASTQVEEKVWRKSTDINADVLKVGHHGSSTSTDVTFLEKVSPEYALISAGRNNRYGHPHPEVVEKLEKRGVHVYQTPLHGAVQYNFSGQTGTFTTFLPYNAIRRQ
ncbi:DNA internalization-related competence protein ComEC/Rec2 [Halobacillus fulvus]|nr:DNA internalization-related competence protein ComEC/Rec2 [Halobacillus fulvus]